MMRRRPRGPRLRRWPEFREGRRRGIYLLPSLLTTGNLLCGFGALLLAAERRYTEAAVAIFAAMVLDFLDGRVARLMRATSQFGLEYDSLADAISFCAAPAFLVFQLALRDLGKPAWFGAFLFVICGGLRLARFNVQTATVDRRYFVGLATPAAAGLLASSVLLLGGVPPARPLAVTLAAGTYAAALLMVSTFRYWSFKDLDVVRARPLRTLLAVILGLMIVATHHELFLFLLFVGYALSGPLRRLVAGRPAPVAAPEPETRQEP